MNEELDPKLLAIFAQACEPPEQAQFVAPTLHAIERRERLRMRLRVAVLIASSVIAAMFMPWLLEHTALLFGAAAQRPWIWLASIPLGLVLIYRSGLRWPR